MPNNIDNKLEIIGNDDQVLEVREFLKGEEGSEIYIDLNKIKKMPDELRINDIESGKIVHILLFGTFPLCKVKSEEAMSAFLNLTDIEKKEGFDFALKYHSNIEKYGHFNWYDWSIANWGTKWNAYHQGFNSANSLTFATAWSPIPGLILNLSEIFPDITLNYSCSDFYDSISFVFKNGEVLHKSQSDVLVMTTKGEMIPLKQFSYDTSEKPSAIKVELGNAYSDLPF